ncbi:MAG: LL-diaminopimelate aminotransferase [Anaerolineae bacterium]|nr:LL-diaminopimelate aminotransferase [Anaerolineae bacterium]
MRPAHRLDRIPPYVFAALAARVRALEAQGLDIIRLDIGSPDLPPADFIIEALAAASRRPDLHGYPSYTGTPALRRAIAAYYERRYGVSLHPDQEVLPLIGSKEGIVNLTVAWLDPGDLALVPDPAYPVYQMAAFIAGGEVYTLPLAAENGYLPDLDAIPAAVAQRARLLWLNYPNNPTGATADLAFFERAVHFARRHEILLCHDAPYCDVTFDDYRAPSLLSVPGAREVAVEFNSLSKSHNMAGWRVGMALGNPTAIKALTLVKSNADSGIFTAIQEAAITALTGDQSWLQARNAIYQARRDLVLAGLAAAGIQAEAPQAGLYVWAAVPPGFSAAAFATLLLEGTGVSLTPGSAFGAHGEGFVRASLGLDTERIQEAMRRVGAFRW